MMSETQRGPLVFVLLVSLLAGLAMVATADDQQPMTQEEKVAALEAAEVKHAEAFAPEVHNVNGVRIAWDVTSKTYRSPTADEMAVLAEKFNEWVLSKAADGLMPTEEKVEIKTLDNGLRTAKVPAHFLSAAVVRVDENGKFVTDCADGAEAAGKLLRENTSAAQMEKQ